MSQLYKNYRRRKFQDWKDRVRKRIPEIAIGFYNKKINGSYIPYEKEVLLGRVIEAISNPFYAVCNRIQEPNDEMSEISAEIILKIQVDALFSYVNNKSGARL